jgi:N-acetylglutamate synthase-like GNAT family acetyltransferase
MIRKATLKDFDEIKRLLLLLYKSELRFDERFLNTDWPNTKAGHKYINRMLDNNRWLTMVADKGNNNLCGFASICLKKTDVDRKNMKMAELDCIFIESKCRRKGLATELVDKLINWAKQNDVNRLTVGASYANADGRRFYESMGLKSQSIYLESDI